ncbi:MAG: tRNA (N6-isopentenyl adenosine(37)-C2)-methylthiotransferase MiaB [Flavobacteriaceae bacterium]|nr:tRNA (N6-isopentenyl adenosine(37)-C2)-methylthiotransferase MiaB [Flavobacteriaceae bacterium]MBL6678414.1 tRNA (N6-isopentenyl adenosine(37)-C2)-methylthiotransferase MiaB [Flavobacteriaceae bacterium]
MNFADSEVVASILKKDGYELTDDSKSANLVLLNTCSIRDKAEQTVRNKLKTYNSYKKDNNDLKIGLLGCMAERLKDKLLEEEKMVDLVVGPDSYKDLPNLLDEVDHNQKAVNVILSKSETYGDISPVRIHNNGINAFVSITRGCDNMCTFCVVPFTRGRERSRNPDSILREIDELNQKGYKEITLLGQNVDSYLWYGGGPKKDFKKTTEEQKKNSVKFSSLLDLVASSFPEIRIRFSTSNPQDMTIDVIQTMSEHKNICNYIHLPIQSGSDRILKKMNRLHTREEYLDLINRIRDIIPNCGISHDMITGFPSETERDHQDTLSLMEEVKYDFGYMFAYSERPGTYAAKHFKDDISPEIKQRRLEEIITLQQKHSLERNKSFINKNCEVLIDKESKKSNDFWSGRTTENNVVVFPKFNFKLGDTVNVDISDCTTATLIGNINELKAKL